MKVETSREGGVLTLTLNRPDVLNAFDLEMLEELAAGIQAAREPDVRAVVITGAGRGFCVGQDLAVLEGGLDVGELLRRYYHPTILAIHALEKPVVAAVNGPAAGAGLSLACACDIRVASDAAAFVPAFVGIGLVPDAGGTHALARLLGQARAFEWMTSNRKLTAAEAEAWGLVSHVVAADAFGDRVAELAAAYAAAPTRAIGMTKRLFDQAPTAGLEEQLELEAQLQSAAAQTADFREGVVAFRERRPAQFSGQ